MIWHYFVNSQRSHGVVAFWPKRPVWRRTETNHWRVRGSGDVSMFWTSPRPAASGRDRQRGRLGVLRGPFLVSISNPSHVLWMG